MPQIKTQVSSGSTPSGAFVPQSRTINTTSPLAGGGPLSSDLTLSIDTSSFGDVFAAQVNTFTAPNFFSGPIYGGTLPTGPQRFVTSGELQQGAGTGDAIKGADNFWTGQRNVFSATTAVTISGQAIIPNLYDTSAVVRFQINPTTIIAYHPMYNTAATGSQRLVSSGELAGIASGGGDALRGQDNFWYGSQNVFAPTTTVTISGAGRFLTSLTVSGQGATNSAGLSIYQGSVALSKAFSVKLSNSELLRIDSQNGVVGGTYNCTGSTALAFLSGSAINATQTTWLTNASALGDGGTSWMFQLNDGTSNLAQIRASTLRLSPGETNWNAQIPHGYRLAILASGTTTGAILALGNMLVSGTVLVDGGPIIYGRDRTSGVNRYVTSGELPIGAGTGDMLRGSDNFVYGAQQIFGPQTTVTISGGASILGQLPSSGGRTLTVLGSGVYQGRSIFAPLLDNDVVTFQLPVRFNSVAPISAFGDIQASGELRSYRKAIFGDPDAATAIRVGQILNGNQPDSLGNSWVLVGSGVSYGTVEFGAFEPGNKFTINSVPIDFIGNGRALFDDTKNIVARGDVQISGGLRTYGEARIPAISDATGTSRINLSSATNTILGGTQYSVTASAPNRYVVSGELRGISIRTLDRDLTPTGVNASTPYTQVYTSSIAANLLGSGNSFRLKAIGDAINSGGSPTGFGLRILYGGSVVFSGGLDAATNTLGAGTLRPWRIDSDVQSMNATNRQASSTAAVFGGAYATAASGEASGASTTIAANHLMLQVDSTAAQDVELWVQNGSTDVSSTVTWVRLELQQG